MVVFLLPFFDATPPHLQWVLGTLRRAKNQPAVLVAVFLYMKKQSTCAIGGGAAVVVASCIQQFWQPLPCHIAINVD